MIINSLVSHNGKLEPVEVEIELTPGLPQMHLLGLADQGIRESIYRIRCAIRKQGFKYPRTQQILVNLRPNHFKKSSRGLELAVTIGLLAKTGQIPWSEAMASTLIYGELSLGGEVKEPEDLKRYLASCSGRCLTGPGGSGDTGEKLIIGTLKDLQNPWVASSEAKEHNWIRPSDQLGYDWPEDQARWLQIMAAGGHHGLLAGPSGLGKTTLAKALTGIRPEPTSPWAAAYQKYFDLPHWWPTVEPHHTISSQGLLGGGCPIVPGEITRAHGGVLLLDELLEFDPSCLEALREPLEAGLIRLRKRNVREVFNSEFQLVATTNLCPCGDWVPGRSRQCHYSKTKCMSTIRRVTGPFLDRFQIVFFVQKDKSKSRIKTREILENLTKIYDFQKAQYRFDWNARRPESRFNVSQAQIHLHGLDELTPRRKLSILRVARTLADLEQQDEIRGPHFEEAREWSLRPFQLLKQGLI